MKSLNKSAISLALLAATSGASAGDWSVGVFAGQSSFDEINSLCSFSAFSTCGDTEDTDTALGINLGYSFTQNWGLEFGYIDLGEFSADITRDLIFTSIDTTVTVDAAAAYAVGVGTLPLSDSFSVSGRLGVASLNGDVTASLFSSTSESADDTVAMIGVSLDYQVTESFGIQVRYDNMDELDFAGVGAKYSF